MGSGRNDSRGVSSAPMVRDVESTGEPAIEHLLTIIRKDREWQEQAARKQLVKFFEALGPKHPATVGGRRQLSAVLFS